MPTFDPIGVSDRAILRELAKKFREAVESPRNQETIRLWRAHDETGAGRPLLLTETDGGINMVIPDFRPQCVSPWAQELETDLLLNLYHFNTLGDDFPLEPRVRARWAIKYSGFGAVPQHVLAENQGQSGRGAFHIEPMISSAAEGLEKLKPQTFTVDREETQREVAGLTEVFDGIIPVEIRRFPQWSMGYTRTMIDWLGLENFFMSIYDEPDELHALFAFLHADWEALCDFLEREKLLTPNNENDYTGSGSRGYTARLPRPGWKKGDPLKTQDLWALVESQETSTVSPEHYAEFVFPCEAAIAKRFGRIYYGCCEPVHGRWHVIKNLPNLQRVSVSPWCDQQFCAEAFGKNFVFSRKPNPSLISTEHFDEAVIRADLRTTCELVKKNNCRTEIIMKDVHTLAGEPNRLARWVKIARETIAQYF